MKKKFIFYLFLTLLFTLINNSSSYAAEYNGGTYLYPGSYRDVNLTMYYTPTYNSLTVRAEKDYSGYNAKYSFNGSSTQLDLQDAIIGLHSTTVNTFTGLQPDSQYSLSVRVWGIYEPGHFWSGTGATNIYYLYTDPMIPINVSYPSIGVNSITLNWNNQSNPTNTSYTLQRRVDGSSTWANVITQNNLNQYSDTGLLQNTKYYYRIRCNGKHGGYIYTSEYAVTTSADPAVASALAAKSAAETASGFAQSASLNAQAAKTEATNGSNRTWYNRTYGGSAESVADLTGYIRNTQIPNLETAVTNINNTLGNDTVSPVVKIRTLSGARATSGSIIKILISAVDNKDPYADLQYSIYGTIYYPMPPDGVIIVPVDMSPVTAITIAVKDTSGNVGTDTILIRKL